jgi:hypothetical protein
LFSLEAANKSSRGVFRSDISDESYSLDAMQFLLWSAARRMQLVVLVALGLYGTRLLRTDVRLSSFPAALVAVSLALFALALVQLGRAKRAASPQRTRRQPVPALSEGTSAVPPGRGRNMADVYRTNARPEAHTDDAAATRQSGIALALFALSGALALVAAVAS